MKNRDSNMSVYVKILFLVITFCLITGSAIAADAEKLLFGMVEKVAGAQQYSVSVRMGYDVVQESGQKIEFGEIRKVIVDRPNHIRVDAVQSDGDKSLFLFDGQMITLFSETENVYSQTDHPGDLDSAVRYAVGKMGVRIPLARMLTKTFPATLKRMGVTVDYVERNRLDRMVTDHIAGQLKDVDFQIWMTKDLLPKRIIITYKKAPGQPQFWADYSEWDLAPKTSAETFIFTPPEGAERIDSLLPLIESEAMDRKSGGS